jgi:hypothetical protein
MSTLEIKIHCFNAAMDLAQQGEAASDVIDRAKAFYDFLMEGVDVPKPEKIDYTKPPVN